MASAGKKGKKSKKGQTVSLNDFLANDGNNTGDAVTTVVVAKPSWADDDDFEAEQPRYGYGRDTRPEKFTLPTAPRAALGPEVSDEMIPRDPPFTARIGNLSYDIDPEDVHKFFDALNVKSIRLLREGDSESGRLRGFGYADFEDRQSLIDALGMNDHILKNRKIRINLTNQDGDRRGGDRGGFGNRMGDNRGRRDDDNGEDRTTGDWRSGGGLPAFREDDRRGGDRYGDRYDPPRDRGGYGDRDRDRGYGGDRDRGYGGRDRYQDDRRSYDRDDRRDNRGYGFGGGRDNNDRDRGGGFDNFNRNDRDRGSGFDRYDRNDRGGDRDRGYGGDRDRRDNYDRRDDRRDDRRGGGGGYNDRYNDRRDRGGYERRDGGSADRDDGPRERPRLQLAKRTAPVETEGEKSANSAIFGGAKPVDTTAKEREIEEKLKATENAKNEQRTKKLSERSSGDDERSAPAPATAPSKNIFGNAKPVDTTKREREIEEKLRKVDVNDDKEPKSVPKKIEKRDSEPRSITPTMKKAEEKKPPNFVASNKYAYLPDEEDVGSGKEDSD